MVAFDRWVISTTSFLKTGNLWQTSSILLASVSCMQIRRAVALLWSMIGARVTYTIQWVQVCYRSFLWSVMVPDSTGSWLREDYSVTLCCCKNLKCEIGTTGWSAGMTVLYSSVFGVLAHVPKTFIPFQFCISRIVICLYSFTVRIIVHHL